MSLQRRLANFLTTGRSTPRSITERAPAALMFRRIRTRFSLLRPKLKQTMEEIQGRQKRRHDTTRMKERSFQLGDPVSVLYETGEMDGWDGH